MPNLSTVKTSLIVLNMICLLCGLWLTIVGLVMMYKYSDLIHLTGRDTVLASATKLTVVLGWAIAATGFYGIHGVIRRSYPLMVLYVFLLGVLITFQLSMAALLIYRSNRTPYLEVQRFEMEFDHVLRTGISSERIYQFQADHGCCGKRSFRDWLNDDGSIPTSCCIEGSNDHSCRSFAEGCVQILERYVSHITKGLGIGLLILAAIDFAALLFASCFVHGIKNQLN
ncbi:AAEL013917-PA [Aedes aegypti]|uniref:AAEL013917-PA n=2 Tax=Aedes aegypti TaxID=7159 RepID=A0A1S4G0S3_AEDAE|nr:CD63 antigen [Aedes aegypti]EAT33803.1 AAEL013917-PA [Aedes aegypti]